MEKTVGMTQWPGMFKRIAFASLFVFLFFQITYSICYADNAEVLPKGIHSVTLNGKFFFPVDERYNQDGNEEPIAADFNRPFGGPAFGLPAGAIIGDSVVSFEYDATIVEFIYTYGLNEKLMIAVFAEYWDLENKVNAGLDTTNATLGKSSTGVDFGFPLVPLAGGGPFGDAVPLTTQDGQDLIGNGIDVNGDGVTDVPGYGYKPVGTWSDSGISDIEVGLRYQYYKTEQWRLAFTGGVRVPTGREDDPDNLVDFPFGAGAWALLFQFQNDFLGFENIVLNATFRYDLFLPDEKVMRIPDDVNQPITRNKEKVDRDIGDIIELEASGTYNFWNAFTFSLLYRFGYKMENKISGNLGFAYDQAEAETNYKEHVGIAGLSYSTIPLVQAEKFPIPLRTTLSYRNRFAGENILKSDYIGLLLSVFF